MLCVTKFWKWISAKFPTNIGIRKGTQLQKVSVINANTSPFLTFHFINTQDSYNGWQTIDTGCTRKWWNLFEVRENGSEVKICIQLSSPAIWCYFSHFHFFFFFVFLFTMHKLDHIEICNMPAICWNRLASLVWSNRSIITVYPVTIWTAMKKVRYKFMLMITEQKVYRTTLCALYLHRTSNPNSIN